MTNPISSHFPWILRQIDSRRPKRGEPMKRSLQNSGPNLQFPNACPASSPASLSGLASNDHGVSSLLQSETKGKMSFQQCVPCYGLREMSVRLRAENADQASFATLPSLTND